ncbi:MAG: GTP-binding protein [Promethearchaeota archaeon]
MSINKEELFRALLNNFLEVNHEVEAVIVSDQDGLIIAGEKRKELDLEIVSVLTAVVNPILERIRNEFAFKKFGTASFDTDEYRLLFILIDENTTLSIVIGTMASIDKNSPSGYFLAEKCAQILTAEEGQKIQLTIPNFEYEGQESGRLKDQIYQMHLDTGGLYRFKFIIIGDHEVGKTSLVRRFVEKRFSKDYRATIGLNILSHTIEFLGNEVNFSLWDIGAQQYFKRFRKTYYMGAQAAFIVFDLTNEQSYKNVKNWYNELNDFIGSKDLPIVIIGNKADLVKQRKISYHDGVKLANNLSEEGISRISYIETSALTGENVQDAFGLISYHYIMKSKELEEKQLQDDLYEELNSIMKNRNKLTLIFFSESPYWSPGLQILTEIKKLGNYQKIINEREEKFYKYENGLILKNYLYDLIDVADADGVFCIFDARNKDYIDSKWKDIVIKIIDSIKENKVILIGIRIDLDRIDWSKLMEDFDVNDYLEKKMISLLFFKIGEEYRLEIYDQLKVMLNTIKNIG